MPSEDLPPLPDGLIIFVKKDCPTCIEIEPVFGQLSKSDMPLTVYSQDDPDFPSGVTAVDYDSDLRVSWTHGIETVPTLIHVVEGREMARTVGWERRSWEALTGIDNLGTNLPDWRPGCGSMSVDPSRVDQLEAKFGDSEVVSRRVEFASQEDEFEAMFDRGWSDGLPIIPPTEERVLRMLKGTSRQADEIVAIVPPTLVECSVEKVAINAVMAGCKPEYLPVVLAAVEAACTDQFNMHGLLCTLWFSGPVIIVNGPIRNRIGMKSRKFDDWACPSTCDSKRWWRQAWNWWHRPVCSRCAFENRLVFS